MRRIFNIYLTSVLGLTGLMLLSSCEADLKVKTNAADLDCAVLTEDTYCIKVRNGQINSVKDLALVQDQILTSASGFSLSWKMPETAKGILATKVMLARDPACMQEVKSAEIQSQEQVYTFTNIKDGIYYGCVFAKARAAGLLAAKNNGIRILVETAQPTIEAESEVLFTNGRVMDKNPNIQAIGAVNALWMKTAGPGELTFTDTGAAVPTITASVDGSYTITITATNEVGGKSTKTFILIYDSTPPVLKDIAPILTSAPSVAITAESDEKDLQLYRWEIIRTPGGVSPELQDADSATAELSLPSPGIYELKVSVSDQAGNIASTNVLVTKQGPAAPPVADTINPSAPAAITVAAYSNTTSVSASYTAGSDANFSTHNVKACAASDCSTACLGVSQDMASPVTVSSLVNGSAYYICLQAVDLSGNVSAYVASTDSVTVDTAAPTAPSSLGFGSSFSSSTTLSLGFAVGTDPNFGTHDTRLCTASDCTTGCGSMIEAVSSPVSLTGAAGSTYYGCARSRDLAGNTSSWIASIGTMTIDNSNPTAPAAITIPAFTNGNSVTATYNAGSDFNLATHNVKACTASNCSTGCLSVSQDLSSPVTVGTLVNGTAYYICIQSLDLAGNVSSYVPSGNSVTVDNTNPSAPAAITVPAFSNTANVSASFTAGSDLNFSTHNVKACTANDCSTGCLSTTQVLASPVTVSSLVSGTAYYICLQTVDLASNTSAYLASGNTVTIDTTAPAAPSSLGFGSSFAASTTVSLAFALGTDSNFSTHDTRLCTASDCLTGCGSTVQSATSPVSLTGAAGTTYYGCARSLDLAGNTSNWGASIGTISIDSTNPVPPSAITVAPYGPTSVDVTYTAGTDLNFVTHNVKACTASNCSTGCLSVTSDVASPATVSSLVDGSSYWICLQSVDQAGNTSAYVASGNSVTIDTSNPAAPASPAFSAAFNNTTTAALSWTDGSDTNFSKHNLKACTDSGCSISCTSTTEDTASPGAISGLSAGTAYYACVQSVDLNANTSAWVASAGTTTIDTTSPAAPSAITVPTYTNATSVNVSYTAGTDTNFSTHNVKACTASDCMSGCQGASQDPVSPVTVSSLVNGTTYYICMQTVDLASNTSAYVASSNGVLVDTTNPTAPSNLAWASAYSNSATAVLSWTNGSDSNFFTHNLKACTDSGCGASCTSATEDVATPGSLTGLVDGTTYYACVQSVDLAGRTSAWTASAGTMLVDTTSPGMPTAVSVPADAKTNFTISFTAGSESNPSVYNIKACLTSAGCSTNSGCVGATTTAGSPGTILATALTNGASYYGCVQAVDMASNTSAWAASDSSVAYDTTAPQSPTIAINAGASHTTSTSATLTLGATGASQMYVTNTAGCASDGAWETYSTSKAWTLATANALNTVYVKYQDSAQNESSCASDSITHDSTAPTAASSVGFSSPGGSTTATMSWVNGTDSNFSTNNIKMCTDSGCSAGCVAGSPSSGTTASVAGLAKGTSYYACVQSVDLAGNTASWAASIITWNTNAATVPDTAVDLMSGLVAYYPFDGDSQDKSSRGYDLAPSGGPTYATGKLGSGLSLNGSQSAVLASWPRELADAGSITDNAFTLSAWVKYNGASGNLFLGNSQLVLSGGGGGTPLSLGWAQCAGGACWHPSTSSTALANGTWYHIAVVFGGANPSFYLNGVADGGIGPCYYTAPTSGTLTVAGGLNGVMDELRVYNRSLSAPEITALYNQGSFLPTDVASMIAWFDASDFSSITKNGSNYVTQWNDKSGRGNHMTTASPTGSTGTYNATALNGKPAIVTYDTSLSAVFNGLGAGDQPYTWFIVGYANDPWGMNYSIGSLGVKLSGNQWGGHTYSYMYAGHEGDRFEFGGSDAAFNTPRIATFNHIAGDNTASGRNLYLNSRRQTYTQSHVGNSLGVGNTLNLSANPTYGSWGRGGHSEIIFYNRKLSDTERLTVEAYLRNKWLIAPRSTLSTTMDADKNSTIGNATVAFASSDFTKAFSHPEHRALASITVKTLPTTGTLFLSGVAITVGQSIAAANLGNITLTLPSADWYGKSSFTWTGSDGTYPSGWAGRMTINRKIPINNGGASVFGNPIGGTLAATTYSGWPAGLSSASFGAMVVADEHIWMVPNNADRVVKINRLTGTMTAYNSWPVGYDGGGSESFWSATYDGQSIWLAPYRANMVLKIDKNTGAMTGYNSWPSGWNNATSRFVGAAFDGQSIWMAPADGNMLVKVDKDTGTMTGYNSWPAGMTGSQFSGLVYDGSNLWMIPRDVNMVVRVNPSNGSMTGYNTWPGGFDKSLNSFGWGVFDGQAIWMLPETADRVVKIDKDTGTMTGYNGWPSGYTPGAQYSYKSGSFDGQNIWMVPTGANKLISLDKTTGTMTGFDYTAYWGAAFDGNALWLAPFNGNPVTRIRSGSQPTVTDSEISTRANNDRINSGWEPRFWFATNYFSGNYSDPAAAAMTKIKITQLPDAAAGTLVLNGVGAVTVGQEILLASIPSLYLSIGNPDNWVGTTQLSWQAHNGTVFSSNTARMTLKLGVYRADGGHSASLNYRPNATMIGSAVKMTGHNTWPSGYTYTAGNNNFFGGIFDGQSIWMTPFNAGALLKVDKDNGTMTRYSSWPAGYNGGSFMAGAFDGQNIWLVPFGANMIVKVNKTTGAMTGYDSFPGGVSCNSGCGFGGAAFDGQSIWMVPDSTTNSIILKIDKDSGLMTSYGSWPAGYVGGANPFEGMLFDGRSIWALPRTANMIVRIDKESGAMSSVTNPTAAAVTAGAFDGFNIWMFGGTTSVSAINILTGSATNYNNGWPAGYVPGASPFRSAVFDGSFLWLIPDTANMVVRVASNGAKTGFSNFPAGVGYIGNSAFMGGVFDGNSVWMIPRHENQLVKISPLNP